VEQYNTWGRVVSKLFRILSVILLCFALSSLVVYRLRLSSTLRQSNRDQSGTGLVEETSIIEGEIQTVDPGSRTLTLMNDGEEVMLAFDERTAIVESGKPVQPGAIATGTPATVKYAQRGGKKWARRIELVPAEPPESTDAY
jgi:hypothetical protein